MFYEHEELKKLPMERLDEETKVRFDVSKLTAKERLWYERMQDEILSKKQGEPYDVAKVIFKDFETKAYKSEKLSQDMTGAEVLFNKKLDVMNEEFDIHVGAMVADLIFKQHYVRRENQKILDQVDNNATS